MLERFIQKNIESGFKNNKREHQFLNFDGMKNVLILFDSKDWKDVQPIIADLEQNGKNVLAWTVLPKLAKGETHSTDLPETVKAVDLNKELNWMRVLRPEVFNEFANLRYDTLIDLSTQENKYILSLLVRNKSRFCIGITEAEYEKLYDFTLFHENDKTLAETYEQLKIYLAHIQ
ncbi:DUF6913 domain-containing protein [Dysgonomonas macrotermitis]|uniref:Uncharacterized protein n=1 Tax=Dysgonomonas macrotermitis TaxID=1346286 RepID=A0A1M4ZZS8_9BACT|nr:hypothetical protein [Dysgonomonas macrotermitis]SHF23529.1 hypothetical protein SAMN05444362_104241 [Dysgonomonas macrotermitis]